MISGYGIEFTAAGAEIAEETRRLTQAFSSALPRRSLRLRRWTRFIHMRSWKRW